MKVLVTGGAGFIGAHIVRELLKDGHEVSIFTLPNDNIWRLREFINRITIFKGLLEDRIFVGKALKEFQPDGCIHLAWFTEPGKYLDSIENINSLYASTCLFEELTKTDCTQIVGAGTCAEYDNSSDRYLNEDSLTRPLSLYAATKLSCYFIAQQIFSLSKQNFAWGRIFFPYGPQENPQRIIPALITSLLKDKPFNASSGEQVRDYIFVSDVASAFCKLLTNNTNGVFNISSGNAIKIKDLIAIISEMLGKPGLVNFGAKPNRSWEPLYICGKNDLLYDIGWEPTITLSAGLIKTIDWWKEKISNENKD